MPEFQRIVVFSAARRVASLRRLRATLHQQQHDDDGLLMTKTLMAISGRDENRAEGREEGVNNKISDQEIVDEIKGSKAAKA